MKFDPKREYGEIFLPTDRDIVVDMARVLAKQALPKGTQFNVLQNARRPKQFAWYYGPYLPKSYPSEETRLIAQETA